MYIVREREAGNMIMKVSTEKRAQDLIEAFEASDKRDGIYVPDFYEYVNEEDLQ